MSIENELSVEVEIAAPIRPGEGVRLGFMFP